MKWFKIKIKQLYANIIINIMHKRTECFRKEEAEEILAGQCSNKKVEIHRKNELNPIYDLMIIVPAYNVERYIEKCIDSLLNQRTNYAYEIVIVNDGSTDSTGAILTKYQGHNCIRIINQDNRGLSAARNRALEKITGKYIMFVDSDDFLPQDSIEKLLAKAYGVEADIVEGSFVTVNENGDTIKTNKRSDEKIISGGLLAGQCWSKVFKSNLWMDVVFPEGYWYEDTILALYIYQKANAIWTIPDVTYCYLYNVNGISVKSMKSKKAIETYWLSAALLKCLREEDIISNEFGTLLVNQIRINQYRILGLGSDVEKAMFSLSISWIYDYADLLNNLQGKKKKLVASLKNNKLDRFNALCKFWDLI